MLRPSTDLANIVPDDRIVSVDTETSGLHVDDGARVSVVSVAYYQGGVLHSFAVPFDQGPVEGKVEPKGKKQRSLFDDMLVADNLPESEWDALMAWLAQWRHVYHNAAFDLAILRAGHRKWGSGRDFINNLAWDTKIGQWVLDPLENSSLKPTAVRLWGPGEDDAQQALKPYLGPKTNPRYDLVPWEVIGPYAAKDAEQTIRLWATQEMRLDIEETWARPIINFEMDVCRSLVGMMRRGIGFDRRRAMEAAVDAERQARLMAGRLPFNPTPDAARRYFYTDQEAIPHCSTDTGKPSVGECCVRTLVAQQIPGAADWQRYQKISGAVSRWYTGFEERCGDDGRLRSDIAQMGTVNFRFASRRNNLQALPHDYRLEIEGVDLVPPRSLFVPRDGYVLYEMDLSQAELRYASRVAGCGGMLEAIESGDPHGVTARALFNVDPDHPMWFERRQVSKRANFGLLYNIGPDTFSRDLEKQTGIVISRGEAAVIIDEWRSLYPEFPAINKRAELKARRTRKVRLVDGRIRWFGAHEEYHKSFNSVIQGGIAQVMKRAMVEHDRLWPETLILQVHDSLIVEIPEEDGYDLATKMSDNLARIATEMFDTPMTSDVKEWS